VRQNEEKVQAAADRKDLREIGRTDADAEDEKGPL